MEELTIDEESIDSTPMIEVPKQKTKVTTATKKVDTISKDNSTGLINCLRNERVIVRHINRPVGLVQNPKHILYGGMAENAVKVFVTPMLSSGNFVNVLTDSEKEYLEYIMGLEYNALSVYKRPLQDNYWSDCNESGVSKVRLTKQDNILDLSSPEDYIRYKILLANKDLICPSLKDLEDHPKASYQFVIVIENEEVKMERADMTYTMQCYFELGKIQNDIDTLRTLTELLTGRPTSPSSKIEFLQNNLNNIIKSNAKTFLRAATDELLPYKVILNRGIAAKCIIKNGNYYILRDGQNKTNLCEDGQEPTLNNAAKFISMPQHQDFKFLIEAKINEINNK